MANEAISEYSTTAASNTDINGIGILGTNSVVNFDNAFRELMSQLADMNAGTSPLDDTFSIMDPVDNTKIARFDCGSITTATTRVYTLPNAAGTLSLLEAGQTWTGANTFEGVSTFTGEIVASDLRIADNEAVQFSDTNDNDTLSFSDATNTFSFVADASAASSIVSSGMIRLQSAIDASLESTEHALQVGPTSGLNLIADTNEIQARNAGATGQLILNQAGGEVFVGDTLYVQNRAGVGAAPPPTAFFLVEGNFVNASNNMVRINDTRDSIETDIAVRFLRQGTTCGTISTTPTTTAYNTSSDERLKEFTGYYDGDDAISIIKSDPVRIWDWLPELGGGSAIGWGAQTSYAVSPDLATPGDELGQIDLSDERFNPWGVDQGKRTPYLWAAVSRLIDRIDELEARVAALEVGA